MHRKLEITDFAVLNALQRVLLAAKFQANPSDRDIPGSPLVADLANQVADLCTEYIVREGLVPAESAEAWREPRHHPNVIEWVRLRIRECDIWRSWSAHEREDYVRTLLAPYFPEAAAVQSLLEYGDAEHGAA
jgi:hypothetical protein